MTEVGSTNLWDSKIAKLTKRMSYTNYHVSRSLCYVVPYSVKLRYGGMVLCYHRRFFSYYT